MEDGLFEKFDVEHVWGMHNWPGLETGKIAIHDGACMASADHFRITISSRGSHAAMPHQSQDPIIVRLLWCRICNLLLRVKLTRLMRLLSLSQP